MSFNNYGSAAATTTELKRIDRQRVRYVPITEPVLRAKKFRLYPTAQEKKILHKWINAARRTYNECLRV
ncbi:hypothetical protein V1505DRAFT_376904 [Lipomyces doorenjongii]